jgi:hypothetical protein
VYNACADHGLGRHRVDRLRKFAETINNGNHDIGDTPVPDLVHNTHSERGTFSLSNPDPGDFLGPICWNAKRDMEYLQAKWLHVAARKMQSSKNLACFL